MRKSNMTQQEIVDHLTVDIKKNVEDYIKPALQIGVSTGGYFSVPKLVLTLVDYLGALYCGWNNEYGYGGKPKFTTTKKAVTYIQEVFGQVFADYKVRAELLWQIYRHGTVHLNEPKVLQNGAKTIEWFIFKAGSNERMIIGKVPTGIGQSVEMPVSHLVPMEIAGVPNAWILPIGTTCLYEDLLRSLDVYGQMIQKNPDLENKFKNTVNEMIKPEVTILQWP